ncbi:MAG TPA: DUF3662 and FHA domain-containing protein [Ktedonobacteraceae bacterium]|nr:DUF3662 and FHA domain-containing protein [Ktedonobacteraceae bacterium]
MNRVSPRQNPFSKIQSFFEGAMDRITAAGPGELEPAEIAHKLANAMEDNLQLQAGGIRLAPNVYDIYLSIEDHRRLSGGQTILIEGWRRGLEDLARQRHYVLRTSPIIRLHADSKLHRKVVHVTAELQDAQHLGGSDAGITATKVFNIEDMRRAQAALPDAVAAPPFVGPGAAPSSSFTAPGTQNVAMPPAWLTIRLPQAGQEIYHIQKPEINIGRQRSNDIIVEDKRVSRLHAKILYQNGHFTIFDLGSVNGIAVNGIPHVKQHTLRSGDRFTVGSYDFYFDERR